MRALFLALLFFTSFARAFTLNSSTNPNFKGWPSGEINFAINTANCPAGLNINKIMEDAFEVWNSIPTTPIKLKIAGSTSSTTAANPVTVYCEVNFAGVTGADNDSVPGAAALAASGDFAVAGILYLNASAGQANISLFNSTLLTVILAHEIGHIIGLGHSHDVNALMYYDASAKNSLGLAQDDLDGISYLYPRDELGKDKPMGCALVKNQPPPSGPQQLLIGLFLILPLLASLRLRKRLRK